MSKHSTLEVGTLVPQRRGNQHLETGRESGPSSVSSKTKAMPVGKQNLRERGGMAAYQGRAPVFLRPLESFWKLEAVFLF